MIKGISVFLKPLLIVGALVLLTSCRSANDTTAPTITAITPTQTPISDPHETLVFGWEEEGTGIDDDSLQCMVKTEDWTPLCAIDGERIVLEPDDGHTLPEGSFEVTIRLADKAGNEAKAIFVYEGHYDMTPPSISLQEPPPGEVISNPLQPLLFLIEDDENGSGIDAGSVMLTFDDENRTVGLKEQNGSQGTFLYLPDDKTPLPYGAIAISVSAKDVAGNEATRRFTLFVREKQTLSALPVPSVETAYAPVTVRFTPKVTTDTAVVYYEWDLDGDGTFEISNLFPDEVKKSFTQPGDYTIGLRVEDTYGRSVEQNTTVHILNRPPSIDADLFPSNGPVPLTVSFLVTASDNEGIAKYEWDFDGDGTWDYMSTTTGDTNHTYEKTGIFNAKLRVTDSLGASALYTTPVTEVQASQEGAPVVTLSASATRGEAPMSVDFDANATDPLSQGFATYRWDFDGDGTWDLNTTSPQASHTYSLAGTFYPRVEAVTTDGRRTVDAIAIHAGQKVTLSVSNDTIDPAEGETSIIRTTLAADAKIRLVIEDPFGDEVREIVPWTQRKAGAYEDAWDGRGEQNASVREGPYYAILYHEEGKSIEKLDLRESTGGVRHSMNRTRANYNLEPLNGKPVRITFTIPQAAEVISFMGYSYSNTRIITFRNREPLGRGSYTDVWYSTNDDGALVRPPSGSYFLYGSWWYSMPDNTIYVKGGSKISEISIDPPIFTPTSHEEEGEPATLKITFDLTAPATAELVIFDATTGTVAATREYTGLSAGSNTIEYDGRDNRNVRLKSGTYTVGIRAVDERGYRSIMRYNMMRIAY